MRRAFRIGNRAMVAMFRLGLGPWFLVWPRVSGRVLVLVHRGRRTGRRYLTPLNYAEVDGDVFCLAGFGPRTDWYQNALADPVVDVWLPNEWWRCSAEDVSDRPDRIRLLRAVLVGSGFAAHLFGIDPKMADQRLAVVCEDYRLVRLRRIEPRTGPGGPGDLAWLWPVAAALAHRRRKRR
jgi:deazaflavin-dependent oxidoreductase (nitroreductase family)